MLDMDADIFSKFVWDCLRNSQKDIEINIYYSAKTNSLDNCCILMKKYTSNTVLNTPNIADQHQPCKFPEDTKQHKFEKKPEHIPNYDKISHMCNQIYKSWNSHILCIDYSMSITDMHCLEHLRNDKPRPTTRKYLFMSQLKKQNYCCWAICQLCLWLLNEGKW